MRNYNFVLSSFCVMVLLIMFYSRRKHLPTWRNRFYLLIFIVHAITMSLNVSIAYVNDHYQHFGILFLYTLCIVYSTLYELRAFLFYCFSATFAPKHKSRNLVMFGVLLFSYLYILGNLFIEGLYHAQASEMAILNTSRDFRYFCGIFYGFSAALLVATTKNMESTERMSLVFANLIVAVGTILRLMVRSILFIDLLYTLSLVVIYFGVQSPDYYINGKTGLFNIRGIRTYIQEQYKNHVSLNMIMISIENYVGMKQLVGNKKMKKLLQIIATKIDHQYRKEVCGYIGSGRFLIISPSPLDFQEANTYFRDLFSKPLEGESSNFLSFYLSYIDQSIQINDLRELEEVIHQATAQTQYLDTDARVVVTNDDVKIYHHRLQIEDATNRAVENDAIQVYYQPIYNTKKHRVSGCEALSRLIDDELGFISPEEFIHAAEHLGIIDRLGFQIIHKVCRFIKKHDVKALGIDYINVNVSPLQCLDEQFPEKFFKILDSYGIDHGLIHVEITESTFVDVELLEQMMQKMSAKGIVFALDDFGTGYSNLTRIIKYPFDIIKIDLSLTWSYFKGENEFLPYIIKLISEVGKDVTVEGVETKEMAESLSSMHVQHLQGYYYSKPIDENQFVNYLQRT